MTDACALNYWLLWFPLFHCPFILFVFLALMFPFFVIQVLLVRDKLRPRRQLPKWSLYKSQRETVSFACKSFWSKNGSNKTENVASDILTRPFTLSGLRTTTKKRRRTEETRTALKHHLPCSSLICGTQSDYSNMGTWNWKSKNTIVLGIYILILNADLKISRWDPGCLADLFHVCVLGETADVTAAPAEATDEGHQKPRPLQSTK